MGAGTYIGRVGGLAVALGVGTAIAMGNGVATAQTTDSSASPSTDSANAAASTGTPGSTGGPDATPPSTEGVHDDETNTGVDTDEEAAEPDGSAVLDEPEGSVDEPTEPTDHTGATEPNETTDAAEPTEPIEPTEPAEATTPSQTGSDEPDENSTLPKAFARTLEVQSDPAAGIQQADTVALFADARVLAADGPADVVPMTAARRTEITTLTTTTTTPSATAAAPDLLTTAVSMVSSVVNWLMSPLAGTGPNAPAAPPLIWGLLAFARREFDHFFAALSGAPAPGATLDARTTTLDAPMAALAATAITANPPYLPFPNAQVSPSTQFVSWVTGNYVYDNNPLLANTVSRYTVWGTDVGTMWDNGIPDNPATPINEHQVLIALGDTFGTDNMGLPWRPNTIFRSSDTNLANGMEIPNGQWRTRNWFGGAPLGPNSTTARQVIFAEGLPAGVTLIPTAGISVPTPGSEFGALQYVSFMSVTQWGAPGSWTTNYSAIAWSDNNGETFHVAPGTVRYNQPWSGNQNFQQAAFVRPGDGYVYAYGTPNGRQGAAYVSRVLERDILDLTKYDYYSKGNPGFFGWGATPAGWYRNNPAAATPVFGQDGGACGVANAGNQVSEMSVQFNKSLNKYVVLYGDQFNNIVMRTADRPEGTWSTAKVLMPQQSGGIYAPMMHPWSPSTMGTGNDLYWNLSLWSEYNVMLMRTDLTKA
jgi:hypothetical protein